VGYVAADAFVRAVVSRGRGMPPPLRSFANARMLSQASVSRDVLSPTPPGPEGSNGNGLLRVQRVPGAWLFTQQCCPPDYHSLHLSQQEFTTRRVKEK